MRNAFLLFLTLMCLAVLRAEDWTTIDGKTYKGVTVVRMDDETVTIIYSDGGAKIPLDTLPSDVAQKLHFQRTELGVYKRAMRETVRKVWLKIIEQQDDIGTVQIKFKINSRGQISEVSTVKFDNFHHMAYGVDYGTNSQLQDKSEQALQQAAPFAPFNAALLKELNGKDSFVDQVIFSVPDSGASVDPPNLDACQVLEDKAGVSQLIADDLAAQKAAEEEQKKHQDELAAESAQKKADEDAQKAQAEAAANQRKSLMGLLASESESGASDYAKASKTKLQGQIFIVTQGGNSVKLGDVQVLLYTRDEANALSAEALTISKDQMRRDLPPAFAETTTDADGKFTISVPSDAQKSYSVFATASRKTGDSSESYYWFVPIPLNNDKPFFLTNDNLSSF